MNFSKLKGYFFRYLILGRRELVGRWESGIERFMFHKAHPTREKKCILPTFTKESKLSWNIYARLSQTLGELWCKHRFSLWISTGEETDVAVLGLSCLTAQNGVLGWTEQRHIQGHLAHSELCCLVAWFYSTGFSFVYLFILDYCLICDY